MRVKLSLGASGLLRCVLLRDIKPAPQVVAESPGALVNSNRLQELTTTPAKNTRPGFGEISKRTSFGKAARRLVREAGAVLDRGTLRHLVFLTGTLPGSTEGALRALSAWSGWVVQTVSQWVRDFAPDSQLFGVWEYQRRGALHLHLCVRVQSEAEARQLKYRWKKRWILALDGVLKRSGVDVYARAQGGSWLNETRMVRTDCQTVEKSVAAYLSKYLSKGSEKNRSAACFPPSAWYFCSSTLRKSRALERREITVQELSARDGLGLFERVAQRLAANFESVVPYQSPVDALVRGCILATNPVVASMVFDGLERAFRMLGRVTADSLTRHGMTPDMVATMFGGRVFSTA